MQLAVLGSIPCGEEARSKEAVRRDLYSRENIGRSTTPLPLRAGKAKTYLTVSESVATLLKLPAEDKEE